MSSRRSSRLAFGQLTSNNASDHVSKLICLLDETNNHNVQIIILYYLKDQVIQPYTPWGGGEGVQSARISFFLRLLFFLVGNMPFNFLTFL